MLRKLFTGGIWTQFLFPFSYDLISVPVGSLSPDDPFTLQFTFFCPATNSSNSPSLSVKSVCLVFTSYLIKSIYLTIPVVHWNFTYFTYYKEQYTVYAVYKKIFRFRAHHGRSTVSIVNILLNWPKKLGFDTARVFCCAHQVEHLIMNWVCHLTARRFQV